MLTSTYLWSSTTYAKYASNAWYMRLGSGHSYSNAKTKEYHVRCVRGGQLDNSNFSSNNEIVSDSSTGLEWQDNEDVNTTQRIWQEAIDYCENTLSLGGYNDWRLPAFSELQVFFKGVAADPGFDLRYWGTFDGCTASVAIGGYVVTPAGALVYSRETGDSINFSGGAAARCVR